MSLIKPTCAVDYTLDVVLQITTSVIALVALFTSLLRRHTTKSLSVRAVAAYEYARAAVCSKVVCDHTGRIFLCAQYGCYL